MSRTVRFECNLGPDAFINPDDVSVVRDYHKSVGVVGAVVTLRSGAHIQIDGHTAEGVLEALGIDYVFCPIKHYRGEGVL